MKVEISEKELARMIKESVKRNIQKMQEQAPVSIQNRSDLSRKGSASATQPGSGDPYHAGQGKAADEIEGWVHSSRLIRIGKWLGQGQPLQDTDPGPYLRKVVSALTSKIDNMRSPPFRIPCVEGTEYKQIPGGTVWVCRPSSNRGGGPGGGGLQALQLYKDYLKGNLRSNSGAARDSYYIRKTLTNIASQVWSRGDLSQNHESEFIQFINDNYAPAPPELPTAKGDCKEGEYFADGECKPGAYTPDEVQLDPDAPVPMSMSQAKTMAREMNHPHLAEPGGTPNQLSGESVNWPLDSAGLRPLLLDFADKIDAVTAMALRDVRTRMKSPKLFNDFVYQLGLQDHPDVDSFKGPWKDITDSMVDQINDSNAYDGIRVFTFSDILRKFATGAGRTRIHFRRINNPDGTVEWVYDPDPGQNPNQVVDRNMYMVWSSIETDDLADMTEEMRAKASTIKDTVTKASAQIDPEGNLNALMAGDIIMNTPKFVKRIITGEDTVDEAIDQFARTLVHEFDHVIYIMLYGTQSLIALDGNVTHGVAHKLAGTFDNTIDKLYYNRSARDNAASFFEGGVKSAEVRSDLSMEAIRDRRVKNIETFIARRIWQQSADPEYAYNALERKGYTVYDVDEYIENYSGKGEGRDFSNAVRGATEIANYVFKRPDGTYEFGNPYDFQPIGDALDESYVIKEQQGTIAAQKEAEYERQQGRGVSGGLGGVPTMALGAGQAWGKDLNRDLAYNSPWSPFNAQEFDAKMAQLKRAKYEGGGAALGMSNNYIWTLDELKTFAGSTLDQIRSSLGPSAMTIFTMMKAPEELNDESLEAFNSIGQMGVSITPSGIEAEVPLEKARRQEKRERQKAREKKKEEKGSAYDEESPGAYFETKRFTNSDNLITESEIRRLVRRAILRNLH